MIAGGEGFDLARVRAIAFDLDGTLVDSRLDLAEAINRARRELELEALPVDAVLGMIGEGALSLARKALGGDPEPQLLERAFAAFQNHYDAVCLDQTRPFPGIDAQLERLAVRFPMALLTNKPERFARKIVEHLGWHGRFRRIVGGDTLATRKPDPEGLLSLAADFEIRADELLLVGDSRVDAETARAAGSPFVFVDWGFAGEIERAALGSTVRIETASALESLLT